MLKHKKSKAKQKKARSKRALRAVFSDPPPDQSQLDVLKAALEVINAQPQVGKRTSSSRETRQTKRLDQPLLK